MTSKLDVEILAKDEDEALSLLTHLAHSKLNATAVHALEGTDTLNIDSGANDIRGKLIGGVIEFWVRYKHDESMYEKKVLSFCRENRLTLRFNPKM